jgi:hypothetical protein
MSQKTIVACDGEVLRKNWGLSEKRMRLCDGDVFWWRAICLFHRRGVGGGGKWIETPTLIDK